MNYNLTSIRDYLSKNLGLNFNENQEKELIAKLSNAAHHFGFNDTDNFIQWLLRDSPTDEQITNIAKYLTVGETYFFRERKALDFIQFKFLPGLLKKRQGKNQQLKIWSAGCASGEEPYSLAILLKRIIPDIENWDITLLATDINESFLEKARKGIYSKWSFRMTNESFRKKHFKEVQPNRYQIDHSIKNMVAFLYHNLARGPFPPSSYNSSQFDIIMCRNVFIYFSRALTERVTINFHNSLLKEGVLLVSPVEASNLLSSPFHYFSYNGAAVFTKLPNSAANTIPKPELVQDGYFPDCNSRFHSRSAEKYLAAQKVRKSFNQKKITKTLGINPVKGDHEKKDPGKNTAESSVYGEALSFYNSGRFSDAETIIIDALANKGERGEQLYLLLARLKANKGELNESEELCKKAIHSNKTEARAHYLLATVLYETGKVDEAIHSLKNTLFLEPEFVLAHFTLGTVKMNKGKAAESKKHLNNALNCLDKLQPEDIVEGSEGLTTGRMRAIISSFLINSESAEDGKKEEGINT